MSRKIILSLAAVATLAGAVLTSNNADAVIRRVGGGGHSIVRPIRPIGYPGGPLGLALRRAPPLRPLALPDLRAPGWLRGARRRDRHRAARPVRLLTKNCQTYKD